MGSWRCGFAVRSFGQGRGAEEWRVLDAGRCQKERCLGR